MKQTNPLPQKINNQTFLKQYFPNCTNTQQPIRRQLSTTPKMKTLPKQIHLYYFKKLELKFNIILKLNSITLFTIQGY